jgi:hypothetical protein
VYHHSSPEYTAPEFVLIIHLQLQSEDEKDWHVVGLDLEPVEPMKRWRVNYTGDMVSHTSNTHFFLNRTDDTTEAEFLEEIQTKVFRDFLLVIQSPVQLCLEIFISSNHAISYSFYSSVAVPCVQ